MPRRAPVEEPVLVYVQGLAVQAVLAVLAALVALAVVLAIATLLAEMAVKEAATTLVVVVADAAQTALLVARGVQDADKTVVLTAGLVPVVVVVVRAHVDRDVRTLAKAVPEPVLMGAQNHVEPTAQEPVTQGATMLVTVVALVEGVMAAVVSVQDVLGLVPLPVEERAVDVEEDVLGVAAIVREDVGINVLVDAALAAQDAVGLVAAHVMVQVKIVVVVVLTVVLVLAVDAQAAEDAVLLALALAVLDVQKLVLDVRGLAPQVVVQDAVVIALQTVLPLVKTVVQIVVAQLVLRLVKIHALDKQQVQLNKIKQMLDKYDFLC